MSDATRIGWTDATWNPTTGCDRISPGCQHCYALHLAARLKAMGSPKYQRDGHPATSGPGFAVTLHPEALTIPQRWRTPRMIFVNSMSDLFHARVPVGFIREVFAVMAATPRHTFQVPTKRAHHLQRIAGQLPWPPNVWMGVSVENATTLHRVQALRTVPAAIRFLSCEPLLGPLPGLELAGIDWVILGGESGASARVMDPAWATDVVAVCEAAGVPVFVKQRGTVLGGRHHTDPTTFPPQLQHRHYPTPTRNQPLPGPELGPAVRRPASASGSGWRR